IAGYRAQLGVQASQERDLSGRITETSSALYESGRRATNYSQAKRDAETKARVSESFQGKLNEITVTSGLLNNNSRLLDLALIPTKPVRPRKLVNLFLGAVCGMLAGIGVVFALDHLDNTVKSIEDVEQGLKLPI